MISLSDSFFTEIKSGMVKHHPNQKKNAISDFLPSFLLRLFSQLEVDTFFHMFGSFITYLHLGRWSDFFRGVFLLGGLGFPGDGGFSSEILATQLSNEKNLGWLGYIGDYTTQLYRDYNKPL